MNNATAEIPIVKAASTFAEIEEIQKFRYQVYAGEMGLDLPGVDHARQILTDPLDVSGIHLYARVGSSLAGAVRLNLNRVPQGLESRLRTPTLPRPFVYCSRLYVLEKFRGSRVMPDLATASFASFYEQNAVAAICHCYPRLLKLYEPLGFRPYGAPFLMPGLERLGHQTPLRCFLIQRRTSRAA
jgi:hypothetical protein